jgi:hypothetical protein
MRILSLVTLILGLAAIVFGVLFVFQANSGNNEIIASIAPLTIAQVEPMYDQISAQIGQIPKTDPNYLPTALQKTSLGLAKANIGAVKAVRMNGFIDIGVGIALVLTGIAVMRKND